MTLSSILATVPPLAWGAFIGALATLVGVFLSNMAAFKRLRVQLESDEAQKKIEREHTIKRAVYLEAADNLHAFQDKIVKLPFLTNEETSAIGGHGLAKVVVLGYNDTIKASNELGAYICSALFELLPKKIPIAGLSNEIVWLNKAIDDFLRKQDVLNQEMTSFNLRGDKDFAFFGRLDQQFKYYQSRCNEYMQQRDQKQKELIKLQMKLQFECYEALIGSIEHYCEFTKCIRQELDIPLDISAYKKNMLENANLMKASLNKFLFKIEEHIVNDNEDAKETLYLESNSSKSGT